MADGERLKVHARAPGVLETGCSSKPQRGAMQQPGAFAPGAGAGPQSFSYKPQRGEIGRSIPHVPLVELDLVSFEQRSQFVLKRPSAVMFFLPADVIDNVIDVGLAHRKRRVAGLPMETLKIGTLGFDPSRCARFQFLDDLGHQFHAARDSVARERDRRCHSLPTLGNRGATAPQGDLRFRRRQPLRPFLTASIPARRSSTRESCTFGSCR